MPQIEEIPLKGTPKNGTPIFWETPVCGVLGVYELLVRDFFKLVPHGSLVPLGPTRHSLRTRWVKRLL